jgi:outer membrane protein assembly factor BamB
MTIPVTCGQCGKSMQVPERMAGKRGKCPGCGHPVEIPVPAPPPAAHAGTAPAAAPSGPPLNVRRVAASPTACRAHDGKPVGACGGCGNPICLECRKAFGYFCGPACRDAARSRKPTEAEEELKAVEKALTAKADALMARARRIALVAGAAVALLVALWIVLAFRGIVAWEARSPVHAFVSAVGTDDGVYAVTSVGKIVSLDPRSGEVRWAVDPPSGGGRGDALEGLFGAGATLRPLAGRLLCVGPGTVAALDPATGHVAWKHAADARAGFPRRGGDESGLAVGEGMIVVPTGGRAVAALDPATGQARWTATLPASDPEVLAAGGACVYAAGRPGTVVCLAAKDGAVAWSWTADAAFAEGAPRGIERLLPRAGGVIAASARRAVCLDAKGKPTWTVEAGKPEEELYGVVLAEAGGRVFYAGHFEGLLIDPATGKDAWRTKIGNGVRLEWTDGRTLLMTADGPGGPAMQKVEGGVAGTIRYAGGLQGGIPTGTGRTLAAVDAATGKTRWAVPAGGAITVRDGVAYTAGEQGKVALLQTPDKMFRSSLVATSVDIATGKVRWQWERMQASATPVATARHLLLVGTAAGEGKSDPPAGFVVALDR